MSTEMKKRSMVINQRRTSVALEPDFWRAVEAEAKRLRITLAGYVALVDQNRGEASLASALRCEIVKERRARR